MNNVEAIIENSFKISGRGLILELRHLEKGLPKDTELTSEKSGLSWRVIARVLYDHAVHEQRIFESEATEYILVRFEDQEKEMNSINRIKERELQSIFQYFLKPIHHDTRPEDREKLIVQYPRQKL